MKMVWGGFLAGLMILLGSPTPSSSQEGTPWCFTGFHPGETEGTVFLPEGDLFCPLLADPKAEHSFVSFLSGEFPPLAEDGSGNRDTSIGSVGIGDGFPLVRWSGKGVGNGVQIGLVGAIFAQFNLDAESLDLINADYLVGLPITLRWAGFSSRLRLYHQSSHLGDEFLLSSDIERENLSFEAVDLLLSQELGPFRAYGGGEILFNRDPETLESALAHAGLEFRIGQLRGIRFLGALDMKSTEQQDWEPGWSVRAGVEVAAWRDETHPPRMWGLFAEFYDGPSPYGQFFQEQVQYLGVGLHLSL